jgi:hypothetical protein
MSMLVLHPNTLMEMDGPLGDAVNVGAEVKVAVSVEIATFVFVGIMGVAVSVATMGVAEALVTPITTGVGVNMDGVGVGGRKGVGPGRGWMIQPLQDVSRNANKIGRVIFFIFSPLYLLYPAYGV